LHQLSEGLLEEVQSESSCDWFDGGGCASLRFVNVFDRFVPVFFLLCISSIVESTSNDAHVFLVLFPRLRCTREVLAHCLVCGSGELDVVLVMFFVLQQFSVGR